jgi:hypothetical protein
MNHDKKQGCLGSILQAFGFSPQPATREQEFLEEEAEPLPYHIRDDFLSPAELNFYRVLCTATGDWAVVCPKVSLGDLFYAQTGSYATNVAYRNKIDRKHVDFLLCDAQSIYPLVGIELDDGSHQRAYRQERDRFVEEVFEAAGLPLLRIEVQTAYNVQELSASLREWAGVNEPQPASQTGADAVSRSEVASAPVPAVNAAQKASSPPANGAPPTDAPPACPKCGQPMVLRVVKKEGLYKGNKFWGCRDFPRCRGVREHFPEGGG